MSTRQHAGQKQSPESENSGARNSGLLGTRLLVPVAQSECGERLAVWLQSNPQLSKCDILLVHVIEPEWRTNIPFSGLQAQHFVETHSEFVSDKHSMLCSIVVDLQKQFPEMYITGQIRSELVNGAAFAKAAKEWQADSVIVFSTRKTSRLFGHQDSLLVRNIMSCAECTVQVIQTPRLA